jgi:hypothetical protein
LVGQFRWHVDKEVIGVKLTRLPPFDGPYTLPERLESGGIALDPSSFTGELENAANGNVHIGASFHSTEGCDADRTCSGVPCDGLGKDAYGRNSNAMTQAQILLSRTSRQRVMFHHGSRIERCASTSVEQKPVLDIDQMQIRTRFGLPLDVPQTT